MNKERILCCFEEQQNAINCFKFMAAQVKIFNRYARIDFQKMIIETNEYIVDFRKADHNRIAGITCEMFWTDSVECASYLTMTYHGRLDIEKAYLNNLLEVLDILKGENDE